MKKYIITLVLMLLLVFSANAGEHGSSLCFDGIDQHITCANDVSLQPTDKISVEMRVMFLEIDKLQVVLNKHESYQIRITNTNITYGYIYIDAWYHTTGTFNIEKNKWYYMNLTYDKDLPSENIKFFVDTTSDGTLNETGSINSTMAELYVGGYAPNFSNIYIDEVRIYRNRVITQQEREWNVRHPGAVYNSDSLVLWLKFNEFTGVTAGDSSGTGNDGTLQNSPTWNIQSPVIAGKEK